MHVNDVLASTSFMQIVHVLGDERHLRETVFQGRKGGVGWIGFHFGELASSGLVEPPHEFRVRPPRFGRRHVFDAIVLPKSIVVPKRPNTGLCRNACSCQHHHSLFFHTITTR